MITVFVHRADSMEVVHAVDPAWLEPRSGVTLWADLAAPTPDEFRILSEVFRFHPIAVEDAVAETNHPKIEQYRDFLYLVLHGIDFKLAQHKFATHDTDFFLGPNYLVTVHDGQRRTIREMHGVCSRNPHVIAEGPVALLHRIVDAMVDHYRPEVDHLEARLDQLEEAVFANPRDNLIRQILEMKRDVTQLRRVVLPQRDVLGRLARREFSFINDELAYRFRDVYDQLVRFTDEALLFQDRVTSILDAHLTNVSNRLNRQMRVLTFITTVAVPFTVLGGLYGMNVKLPGVPGEGDPSVFWYIVALALTVLTGAGLLLRRLKLL